MYVHRYLKQTSHQFTVHDLSTQQFSCLVLIKWLQCFPFTVEIKQKHTGSGHFVNIYFILLANHGPLPLTVNEAEGIFIHISG